MIHSVKAAKAVLDELECAGTFKNNVCILHWFTGNAVERKRAIDAGAWFSINPKMLKTKLGQDAIKSIPADKLLLETDSPFVNKISSVLELESELKKLVIEIEKIRGEDIQGQIERNCDLIWRF